MTMEHIKILIYNQNKKSILFQQNSILTIFLIKNYIRVPQWNFIFQFQLICNKQDIEYRDTPPTTWNIEILNTFIEMRIHFKDYEFQITYRINHNTRVIIL